MKWLNVSFLGIHAFSSSVTLDMRFRLGQEDIKKATFPVPDCGAQLVAVPDEPVDRW